MVNLTVQGVSQVLQNIGYKIFARNTDIQEYCYIDMKHILFLWILLYNTSEVVE